MRKIIITFLLLISSNYAFSQQAQAAADLVQADDDIEAKKARKLDRKQHPYRLTEEARDYDGTYVTDPKDKCSTKDGRYWHSCFKISFFQPKARVYFDNDVAEADEIDLFQDGNINATIDVLEIYLPYRFGDNEYYDGMAWGPALGLGFSTPAKDSTDGENKASSAPVFLVSLGLMFDFKTGESSSISFEIGKVIGFTSDESFADKDDIATYVGITLSADL